MASVYKRGTKWYACIKVNGEWKNYATGKETKTAAWREADEMQERADAGLPVVVRAPASAPGNAPAPTKPTRLTVADLAEKFLTGYDRGRIKDIDAYRTLARGIFKNRILPFLGHLPADEVRRVHIATWTEQLRKVEWTEENDGQVVVVKTGYSNAAINQTRAFLSRMYTWAGLMEILNCRNPLLGEEQLQRAPLADHCFSLDEARQLLKLPELPLMARTALYTGLRKGELYGLTWPCVRLDSPIPCIEVRRSYNGPTKNGKPRTVPIHPELLPILREWKERCPKGLHPGPRSPRHAWTGGKDEFLVFPVHKGRGQWGLRGGHGGDPHDLLGVYRAAGVHVPTIRPWHALRHTFATLAVEAGAARDAVEMMLGHRSSGSPVTSGYLHLGLPYLARELVKLALLPVSPAKRAPQRRRQAASARAREAAPGPFVSKAASSSALT